MEFFLKNVLIFVFLLLISLLNAEDTTQVAEENTKVLEVEQVAFVQVSTVPQDAAKVLMELKKIEELVFLEDSKEKAKEVDNQVKPYCDSLVLFLASEQFIELEHDNIRELQKKQSELAIYTKQLLEWEISFHKKIKIYDDNRDILSEYSKIWTQTHVNATKENAPQEITQHITSVIIKIEELENRIKKVYDDILILSQMVTTNVLAVKEKSNELKDFETLVSKQIFFQNEEPLLDILVDSKFSLSIYINNITSTIVEKYHEMVFYFQTHKELYWIYTIALFISSLFALYASYLYRSKKLFLQEESYLKSEFFYIKNFFSVIVVFSILIMAAVFPERPKSIIDLILLSLLIPSIRIVQTVIDKSFYKYLYLFAGFIFIFTIAKNSDGDELESRLVLLLMQVSFLVYLGSILKNKIIESIKGPILKRIAKYTTYSSIVFLPIAVIANLYGAVLLSTKIIDLVLSILYMSGIFYILHLILTGYVVIILRRRISTASNMLDKFSHNIEHTTKVIIRIWMLLWWLVSVLKVLGVYAYAMSTIDGLLAFSWDVSGTIISVKSIVDFIFIVISTWVIAKVIKTILEVEVFSRFKLPRGMPTAILTVTNYIVVISGTIVSFSSLGVNSQQFAIVFGALGVGIGFGLRNIIANFVSGIIMVFERPVQLGDTIELGGTMGSVQSIGARASTLKTFDGSEVIIPNADFIGKEIVNWTLSDERRRKIIEFKVDLDNDIDTILDIMRNVAIAHPDVLQDPEPLATFKGFGEYTLDFKIYFWLSDNLIVAQSDIAIGIYKELQKAGVNMPVKKTHIEGGFK